MVDLMITDGLAFLTVIVSMCASLLALEQALNSRLFTWFPPIVLVMFGAMLGYTLGAWEFTESVRETRESTRDLLIPMMLFLMSLKFRFSDLKKLGPKIILLCLVSATTIVAGFVITHLLMSRFLGEESSQTFGVMAAGWTGGTQNFVAIKEALQVTDSAMSYTLLMGALCYSVWLVVIMALRPHRQSINRKLGLKAPAVEFVCVEEHESDGERIDVSALMTCLGISLLAASISTFLGSKISSLGGSSAMLWTVILSTFLGALAAHTPLKKIPASGEVSGVMLYIIVALIGSEVSLTAILDAPFYILSGFIILSIHGAAMITAAKILKIDIAVAAIASVANIGSAPSATVVAATYGEQLIPTAILMSLFGSLVGSFLGLLTAEVLSSLA
ncbi:MAG TPA: hypothetical protein DEF79_02170 [Gammaproteobacteria bacterium]|nr:hypothetical protein [Gammaproteobacteria bacterium]